MDFSFPTYHFNTKNTVHGQHESHFLHRDLCCALIESNKVLCCGSQKVDLDSFVSHFLKINISWKNIPGAVIYQVKDGKVATFQRYTYNALIELIQSVDCTSQKMTLQTCILLLLYDRYFVLIFPSKTTISHWKWPDCSLNFRAGLKNYLIAILRSYKKFSIIILHSYIFLKKGENLIIFNPSKTRRETLVQAGYLWINGQHVGWYWWVSWFVVVRCETIRFTWHRFCVLETSKPMGSGNEGLNVHARWFWTKVGARK